MSLKEDLHKLYWDDRLSQSKIGKIYGKSTAWVCLKMNKLSIPVRNIINIKTRFLNHVKIPENPNGCWIWTGNKLPSGYGRFWFKEKLMYAHRVSYILHISEFDPTLCCLHKCDNRSCVNPNHLFLGNNKDNIMDMIQKGRNAKGEQIFQSKLTEEEIKEIKNLLLQGISCVEIGRLFKVDQSNIHYIKHGHTWKHMEDL